MKLSFTAVGLLLCTLPAHAKMITQDIEYQQGTTTLQGYLAYDDAFPGKRPGVLVAHQWMGLSDYEKRRARMLAEMGYVAFALDIYGQGVRPQNRTEAAAQAGKYRADRPLLRLRARAALDALRARPNVDAQRIAAIGYCFGGGTVLELARSGAPIRGAVSFHGNLDTPDPSLAKNIVGKVLVLHGAIDPNVPPESVLTFRDEMEAAKVDYQIVAYGGAVHSFTDWNAGNDPSQGAAYNENADRRSWQAMQNFFAEIF